MNADLEDTIASLEGGGGFAAKLAAAASAFAATPSGRVVPAVRGAIGRKLFFSRLRLAAAACVAVAAAWHFASSPRVAAEGSGDAFPATPYTLACSTGEASLDAIVRTQRPDGGWESDYLTQQNAAALRHAAGARTAYLRALRNLRSKGLEPISDEELARRRESAGKMFARS